MNLKLIFLNNYHNAIPLALRYFFVILIGVFQVYLFTHFVDQKVYGQFQYIVTILSVLSLFSLPGSNLAFTKMGALKDEGHHFSLVKLRIKSSFIASLCLALCSIYFQNSDPTLSLTFLSSSFIFPFVYSLDSYLHILSGREYFTQKAVFEILKKVLIVSTLIYLIYSSNMNNLLVLTFALLTAEIICHGIGGVYIKKNKVKSTESPQEYSFYKQFTQNMTFVNFLGVLETKIDRLIVGTFLGFTNLAIFHVGKVILEQVKSVWVIISTLLLPKIFKKSKKESYRVILFIFPIIWIFFGGMIGVILFFLQDIVTLWFGVNYIASIPLAKLMLYSAFLGIPHTLFITYLSSQNMVKEITKIRLTVLFIYFTSLIILTSYYSLYGVVYAWLIKTTLGSILASVVFLRSGARDKFIKNYED